MADSTIYDVIIIGGGHNGLTAAALLAKAGRKILVLEKRPILGGAATNEEVFPGFQVSMGAVDAGLFLPEIVTELELKKHGLSFIESPAMVTALQPAGESLTLWRDPQRSQTEIARFSRADAEQYPKYLQWISQMTGILQEMMTLTPPQVPDISLGGIYPWLKPALNARRLGRRSLMEFMRALPMPVSDFLDEWFATPLLKAALGAQAVLGAMNGPRASGTVFMLLYQAVNAGQAVFRSSRFVSQGTGKLIEALAGSVRAGGGEIRTGAAVSRLIVDGERVTGVVLQDGQQIFAQVVLSSTDPRQTFFDLIGTEFLEVSFVRQAKNIRFRGSTARVNLALERLPEFSGLSEANDEDRKIRLSGHTLVCPDLDYLERAYDDAKYGRLSQSPALDIIIPTILDDTLAPEGKHLMSINVQYAPFKLKEGSWQDQRQVLIDRTLATLEIQAPGISKLLLHSQALTPLDLQEIYSLPDGDLYHGQMALDQLLFMRPVAGYGQYATPLKNLYLCGAGAHPGGGLTGAPGYNAARYVLKHG